MFVIKHMFSILPLTTIIDCHIDIEEKSEACDLANCACRNCRALLGLIECGICFDQLRTDQAKLCPVCANVFCVDCATQLTCCAFCRSEIRIDGEFPPELLPCKNFRSGCSVLLNDTNRFSHESLCNFSTINCPVSLGTFCRWQGTVADSRTHLLITHDLEPLCDCNLSIEANKFQSKSIAANEWTRMVGLECFDQLFVIEMQVVGEGRLRLAFTRLGAEDTSRYEIQLLVGAQGGNRLRALVPFGRFDRDCRQLDVMFDKLYPSTGTEQRSHVDDDLIKIDLLVKRMSDATIVY